MPPETAGGLTHLWSDGGHAPFRVDETWDDIADDTITADDRMRMNI